MHNFINGVNLGGWLSQYAEYDHEHFRTFITRRDIEQIAAWGMDHVRLPVDYPILESDNAPGVIREESIRYVDDCMAWCRAAGLGLVFDLHRAPGYSFNNTLELETQHLNVLFDQEAAQQRFVNLWEAIVRRYHDAGLPIVFELLNEVVLPDSGPWNALAHRTVTALRAISPDCDILIGGNYYNAAAELENIALHNDPHVFYTFHFYEPVLFTHQKAPWSKVAREFDQTLDYPGEYTNLKGFLERAPQYRADFGWRAERRLDRDLLLHFFQPVVDFIQTTGHRPYCGEYGVIETAPAESRRRWHIDLLEIFDQHRTGRAVWSYKAMDFGLVDRHGAIRDADLIDILARRR
ncbi:MAG: glycoside hydrolase family 5 protein [Anaerolineae bacterium]